MTDNHDKPRVQLTDRQIDAIGRFATGILRDWDTVHAELMERVARAEATPPVMRGPEWGNGVTRKNLPRRSTGRKAG